MKLRAERDEDADATAAVHRSAFSGHPEQVCGLVERLRATIPAASRVSLVAEDQGAVVGHVMFTRGFLDAAPRLLEVHILSPLGVVPAQQGRGVGSRLVQKGVEIVAGRGVPAIFLEGDPAFYGRFGFVPAASLGFEKPSDRIPDFAFQVFATPSLEPWMRGRLVYPEAFWLSDAVGRREDA